jgi:glycosyltransferase involved in cell wall biosynthesis
MATIDVLTIEDTATAQDLDRALHSNSADVVIIADSRCTIDRNAKALLSAAFHDESIVAAYTDESVTDSRGRHLRSSFKPDWSPERLRGQWYIGDLLAVRRVDAIAALDSIPKSAHGVALRWELMLRLTETGRGVAHIPRSLVSRKDSDPAIFDRHHSAELLGCTKIVQEHCDRVGIDAVVEIAEPGNGLHLKRVIDSSIRVSLIIPTRGSTGVIWGQERNYVIELVASIVELATWPDLEFVVVADSETPAVVHRALTTLCGNRLVWVPYDQPFNFSDKINKGRAAASGNCLVLLNDDMQLLTPTFIEELVGLAMEPGVGAVGAKLLLADGRLQHIGHRYANGTYHLFAGYDGEYTGPDDMLTITRECIGVTAACLAVRPEHFDEVGGMAIDLPNNFNDVDFVLRLKDLGLRNLVTPHATLFHFESVTRDATVTAEEANLLFSRWGAHLNSDPYSNPNLQSGRVEWIERGRH